MATNEQITEIIRLMEESKPENFFRKMNGVEAGIGAVLRFLSISKKPMTAGSISRYMGVSTARVAALLKKMETKNLIIRESGAHDARTTMVSLSEQGQEKIERLYQDYRSDMGRLIDRVGMERLIEFISTLKEIMELFK